MRLFEMDAGRPPLLVVVHPGSACGSADFNLGEEEAGAARQGLIHDLNAWKGAVLVADGELSDELPRYPGLDMALNSALVRAKHLGAHASRVFACAEMTPDFTQVIVHAVQTAGYQPGDRVCLTGAWVGQEGCVTATAEDLIRAGFEVRILAGAIAEPVADPDQEYEQLREDWDNYQEIGHREGALIYFMLPGGKIITYTSQSKWDTHDGVDPNLEKKAIALGRIDLEAKKISVRTPLVPGNMWHMIPEAKLEFIRKKLERDYPGFEIWYYGNNARDIRQINSWAEKLD